MNKRQRKKVHKKHKINYKNLKKFSEKTPFDIKKIELGSNKILKTLNKS